MVGALEQARADGGEVIGGERHDIGGEGATEAFYVAPAVVRMPATSEPAPGSLTPSAAIFSPRRAGLRNSSM